MSDLQERVERLEHTKKRDGPIAIAWMFSEHYEPLTLEERERRLTEAHREAGEYGTVIVVILEGDAISPSSCENGETWYNQITQGEANEARGV